MLGTLQKDNTGYDLEHLFIESSTRRKLGEVLFAFEFLDIHDPFNMGVPEALLKAGAAYEYDLSLPIEHMYNIVEDMRLRLAMDLAVFLSLLWLDLDGSSAKVVGYGHLGDGNLHLNISAPQYDDAILSKIEPFVNKWTSKHRGSISVEHGLMKADKLHYSKSSEIVLLMAEIKKLLDPSQIMNPYKVLLWSLLFHG